MPLKGEGIAKVFNDLSNPTRFTLSQRAVGSTPARPTKSKINHFQMVSFLPTTGVDRSRENIFSLSYNFLRLGIPEAV